MKRDKNFWKRLSHTFNDYAAKADWKHTRALKVSHTSLFPVHAVGRGPNTGEPTLLEFGTRLVEANGVLFHYEARFGSIQIYLSHKNDSQPNNIFFEVRKNGKNQNFVYLRRAGAETQEHFIQQLLKTAKSEGRSLYDLDCIREELIRTGYSVVSEFAFSEQLQFRMPHHGSGVIQPTYVKQTANAIEIGWISSGTYNAIPQVVRIECIRKISTVSLCDLGIETNGYYDGHYRCEVRTAQAREVKAFFSKRFK